MKTQRALTLLATLTLMAPLQPPLADAAPLILRTPPGHGPTEAQRRLYPKRTAAGRVWGRPSADESLLLRWAMAKRAQAGQPPIPTSRAMMIVAQAHASDLDAHPEVANPPCNTHSWSRFGPWIPVCYTEDHAQAQGMWQKPSEIAGYPGKGFEIAISVTGGGKPITPLEAVEGWLSSPGHKEVLLSQGKWAKQAWRAVGASMVGDYAVMWFGHESDPTR